MVPSLTMQDIRPGRAGVRAVALGPDGNLIDDYKIVHDGNITHILNTPSPGATSSLAIGDEIVRRITAKV